MTTQFSIYFHGHKPKIYFFVRANTLKYRSKTIQAKIGDLDVQHCNEAGTKAH